MAGRVGGNIFELGEGRYFYFQQKSPKTFTKMFPKLSKLSVSKNFEEKVVGKNSGGI